MTRHQEHAARGETQSGCDACELASERVAREKAERERDEARAINNRVICVWCGWQGERTSSEETEDLALTHMVTCEERPEARLIIKYDRALVTGAVLVHAAREALTTLREGCPTAEKSARALYGDGWRNGVIDAALKVLDGGGDVWEWAEGLYEAGRLRTHSLHAACVRAFASPPALPDATAALTAFAASIMDWTLSNTMASDDAIRRGQIANFVRRWLRGGDSP